MQLLQDPRIGVYELAVYAGLAAHAEVQSGDARPSVLTLAEYGCMSERRARDAIRSLEAAGYVSTVERKGWPSRYTLLPPPPLTPARGAAVPDGTPAPDDATPARGAGTPARGAAELEEEPEEEQEVGDTSPTIVVDPAAVDRLCHDLADRMAELHPDGARPKVTDRWRRDMRLLIERGPAGVEDPAPIDPDVVARRLHRVFTELAVPADNGFCWAAIIRSPGGLRDKWTQISAAVTPPRATATASDKTAAAAAAQYERVEAQRRRGKPCEACDDTGFVLNEHDTATRCLCVQAA